MKFYRLSDAAFYDHIDTIYQFIKPFLDKKCLFLRDMEPLNGEHFNLNHFFTCSNGDHTNRRNICFSC